MDRNTGGLGYNKNIAQIHSMLVKMPDSYLSKLIQDESPFATVATMVLDTRQGAAQSAVEPPTSTVADKIVSQVGGIPSVAPQQNNQDPRLMEGVGGMALTERNSADTPISGIAQLPAQQMMADGGIVGYAEGGETKYFGKDGVIFDPTNPLDYLMAVPGLGVGYGAARLGYKGLKALPALGRTLNPSGRFKNLKTALGRRQLGKATKGSKTDTELRSRTMKGRRDPETGLIRSNEAIGAGVLAPYAKYGSQAAGLGALGYFGSGLLPEGSEEEPKANETLPDMSGVSNFDKDGFMKTLFRQGQLTGKNIATDATGQGLLGSALGGYGKATGDLAASDIAQDNKLEQLRLTAASKGVVTASNKIAINKQIQVQKDNGDFITQAQNALETGNASEIQAILRANGIVASGPEQLLTGLATLYEQKAKQDLLAFAAGQTPTLSTAGYSVAPSTTG